MTRGGHVEVGGQTGVDGVTVDNVMEDRWVVDVPLVHDSVKCVGCRSSPIVGKRYECDQCYSYNLCEDCWSGRSKSRTFLDYQTSVLDVEKNGQRHLEQVISYNSETRNRSKVEHKSHHSFTDVINDDTPVTRALRLKKDCVFKSLLQDDHDKKWLALVWGMNNERSTQMIASYLLDMKEEDGETFYISNSVLNTNDSRQEKVLDKALRNCWADVALTLISRGVLMDRKHTLIRALMNNLTTVASNILNIRHEVTGHYLLTKEDINSVPSDQNILIWTIRNKMVDEAVSLLARGADWDVQDRKMMTPLMWACKTNQPRVVEKLLLRTTKDHINRRNREKMTALGIAVANKSDECIQKILQCGVTVDMYSCIKRKILPCSYRNIKTFLDSQIDKVKPKWANTLG